MTEEKLHWLFDKARMLLRRAYTTDNPKELDSLKRQAIDTHRRIKNKIKVKEKKDKKR